MEYALMNCTREKKQGPTGAGHLLFACMAAILLLVTFYQVDPLHHMHQQSPLTTFLVTGSISSCSTPETPGSAALISAVAELDVDCSFRVEQSSSSRKSAFAIGFQQSTSNQVPQLIQVSGLDTLTCALTKAMAKSSTVSGDMMPSQQQYVFLLQPTGPRGLEPGVSGASFQVIEYAPLSDSNLEESLAFLLSEWSQLAPGGITQLGCNKPSLGSTRAEGGVSSSTWGLDIFKMQMQRQLLQDAAGSPSASSGPSTPISLAPISVTDFAADQLATSPTNAGGLTNQTAAGKSTAPALKADGNSNQTTAASGPKASSNSTIRSNNTAATTNSTNGSDTSGEAVEAAVGPTDVQQQQALAALLSGNPGTNATLNGTSPVNKTAVCLLPAATGPCRASIPRWGYDATQKSCIEFVWGGCQGNENRFETMQACHDVCAGVVSSALPGSVNGSTGVQGTAQPKVPAAPTTGPAAPLGVPANSAAASPAAAAPNQAPPPHVYLIPTSGIPEQVVIKAPAPAAQSASSYLLPADFMQLSVVGLLVVCQLWLL